MINPTIQMSNENTKKVVLISGTSSGIGLATSVYLSKLGTYKVYATMRDLQKQDKLLESARTSGVNIAENLAILQLDVTKEDTIMQAVQQILKQEGRIDVLICNAGYGLFGLVEITPIEEVKGLFDTNVFGAVRLMQHVLPYMRQQKSGLVIGMSSVNGIQAEPGLDFYSASKFALEAIFEAEAPVMRRLGIHFVLVESGMVQSEMVNNAKMHASRKPLLVDDNGFYKQFEEGYTGVFEQNFMFADPVDDLVKLIHKIMDTPLPNLRYQFGVADETAKSKLVDPTGNSTVEMNNTVVNFILPQ